MQALMLAAGMGRRLGKYTKGQTKCMVKVGGKTLLEHAADALRMAGIHKFVIVTGYAGDKLEAFARETLADFELEFIHNPDYASTNNIYSLYLAHEALVRDDTLLLESDLIYEPQLLRELVNAPQENMVTVAKYESWMDGTVTLLDDQGYVREFIEKKDFRFAAAGDYYKTVNIYKFSRDFAERLYVPFLRAYIQAYGKNQYYELVLKTLAHTPGAEMFAHEVGDIKWYEIDDAQDLDIADTLFATDETRLAAYELHFGGFWRFSGLRDFCYLVNPYYPPAKMRDQMKYFFDPLLTQYPSGMRIQRLLAGRCFGVSEDHLLVGNGAAELINTLGRVLHGTMALPVPAFNEYVRCFRDCEIRPLRSADWDFSLDLDALKRAARENDNLVLVNPDNPSGAFLGREALIELLEVCKEAGTRCVVDESFVDFAEPALRYTLLDDALLERYPTLVVMKSISKSYGVPGLRLGVIASADTTLLDDMRGLLPIWNINSFAEYFMQIFTLYESSYAAACDRIAEQRAVMAERLGRFPFLKPYPSQANYILCAVSGLTSKALAERLLTNDRLLIKDCSHKNGIDGASFVRIAVRDEADNEALYAALEKIEL